MADETDDLHDQVLSMADRLGLKGNDRRRYVHEHMTRGGFRMEPTYVKDEGDEEDDEPDDPFFGKRHQSRSSRSRTRNDRDDDRGGKQQQRRRGGPDDWYS